MPAFLPSLSPDMLADLRNRGLLQMPTQNVAAPYNPDAPMASQADQNFSSAPPQASMAPPAPAAPAAPPAPPMSFKQLQHQKELERGYAAMAQGTTGTQGPYNAANEPPAEAKGGTAEAQGVVNWNKPDQDAGNGGVPPVQTRTVPAHEASTVSPREEALLNEAGEGKKIAALEAQGAEMASNEAQADALQPLQQELERQAGEYNTREDKRAKAQQDLMDERSRLQRDYATGKPDYNRWFRGNHGLNAVTGAIAAALGAAGQVFGGTRQNTALDIINGHVDRDIAEQRDELGKKGEAVKMADNDLANMRAIHGDERGADAGARILALDKVKLKGQEMVQRAQSPMIAAKWDGIVAGINEEQARLQASMHPWVQAQTVTTGGGLGGAISDIKPEEVMQLPNGQHITIPEKDREKVVTAQNKAASVAQAGQQMHKLLAMGTVERAAHPVDWIREYDAAAKTLAAAEIEAGGKGGKGIFEQFQKASGGRHFGILTPGNERAVDQIVAAAQRGAQNEIENSAQYRVHPVLHQNPKTGVVERKYVIDDEYKRREKPKAPAGKAVE